MAASASGRGHWPALGKIIMIQSNSMIESYAQIVAEQGINLVARPRPIALQASDGTMQYVAGGTLLEACGSLDRLESPSPRRHRSGWPPGPPRACLAARKFRRRRVRGHVV